MVGTWTDIYSFASVMLEVRHTALYLFEALADLLHRFCLGGFPTTTCGLMHKSSSSYTWVTSLDGLLTHLFVTNSGLSLKAAGRMISKIARTSQRSPRKSSHFTKPVSKYHKGWWYNMPTHLYGLPGDGLSGSAIASELPCWRCRLV